MDIFKRMHGRIAISVERRIIAVTPSQPSLSDGHLREVDMTEIVDKISNERVLRSVHQVDVNVGAFLQIACHVEVEIAHNVHVLCGAVGSISHASYQANFFSTPVGIYDGAVKGVVA